MSKRLIALALIFNFNTANAGAAAGGASEFTQIANNYELALNVAENARQTSVQMNQLYTALQDVQRFGGLKKISIKMGMNPGALSEASENLGSVKKLRGTIGALRDDSVSLQEKARILSEAYNAAMKTYEKTGVPPSELLKQANELKGEEAKYYKNKADNIQKQADGMVKDMDNINRQANGIPSISGNVKGLQFLATQNVTIQRSLKEISLAITQSMAHKTMEQEKKVSAELEAQKLAQAKDKAEQQRFYRTTAIGPDAWKAAMEDD
jgi:hypothetical protein